MKLDWKIIDTFLIGEAETDDLTVVAKEEINKFLQTHDWEVFSDETLEILAGIWDLAYKAGYEEATGEKIPNIWHKIALENSDEEVVNEQEPLSGGDE